MLVGINFDLIFICFVLNPPTALLPDTRQRFAIIICQLNLLFHAKLYTVSKEVSVPNKLETVC